MSSDTTEERTSAYVPRCTGRLRLSVWIRDSWSSLWQIWNVHVALTCSWTWWHTLRIIVHSAQT